MSELGNNFTGSLKKQGKLASSVHLTRQQWCKIWRAFQARLLCANRRLQVAMFGSSVSCGICKLCPALLAAWARVRILHLAKDGNYLL